MPTPYAIGITATEYKTVIVFNESPLKVHTKTLTVHSAWALNVAARLMLSNIEKAMQDRKDFINPQVCVIHAKADGFAEGIRELISPLCKGMFWRSKRKLPPGDLARLALDKYTEWISYNG